MAVSVVLVIFIYFYLFIEFIINLIICLLIASGDIFVSSNQLIYGGNVELEPISIYPGQMLGILLLHYNHYYFQIY